MDNLFAFLLLVSLVLLVIGLFSPKTSLFWDKKERTRKKSALVYGVLIIFFFILFGSSTDAARQNKSGNTDRTTIALPEEPDLTQTQKDSIKAQEDSIAKMDAIAQKKWYNSKAGKIQIKHPDWSKDDCENIANKRIWIGMSLDMLKYERGTPNRANPSNYGNGNEWQWCWDDYTPSCFYGKDNGIITSYN